MARRKPVPYRSLTLTLAALCVALFMVMVLAWLKSGWTE